MSALGHGLLALDLVDTIHFPQVARLDEVSGHSSSVVREGEVRTQHDHLVCLRLTWWILLETGLTYSLQELH